MRERRAPEFSASQWLDIFRDAGRSLMEVVSPMLGREDAGRKLRRGASGDTTVLIDETAEEIILESLKRAAGSGIEFTLVSEECGVKDFGSGRLRILVDPVDGSNNAKKGIPYCATSIAVLQGDRLKDLWVGYVLDLVSGKEYHAVRGEGAYLLEKGKKRRLSVSRETGIGTVAFEASTPASDLPKIIPLLTSGRKVRCLGAIALDLALMAAGALDVVAMAAPSRSFDFAAGKLILEEAGGVITDFQGGRLDDIYGGLEKTRPLLATANREIHEKALKLIQP